MKLALLAGTQSGCGKTTVMLALLQYFIERGQRISSFKSGPDFLDPLWHQAVTGRPSYNLDTQMIGIELSREILATQASQTDWGVIEGVMGLFDGRAGVGEAGSAADLAKFLRVPVLLVIDAAGMSGSIVPMVAGFRDYAARMNVTIGGVIANKVGSSYHAELLKGLLSDHDMPPLVAWMNKDAPVLAERHLGLVRPGEADVPDFQSCFHVDEAALLEVFVEYQANVEALKEHSKCLIGRTVAIANDAACCFIYPANVDWLLAQGAEILYFSPLAGESVPQQADALWLPGGYPELYGQQLAASTSWESVRCFIEADKPVLAECGGAMLLGEQLIMRNGISWPMVGLLPFNSRMQDKLASLGYREDKNGVRGHEFHHSVRESERDFTPVFDCGRGDRGIRYKNLRASYIHWYFASAPAQVVEWLS